MRDDHAELRRDDVEPLGRFLADHMHRRAAARAIGIFRSDRHVDVRQMGRKRATIGASLISALACARRVLLVLSRLVGCNGLLDVLDCQQQCSGSSFSERRPNCARCIMAELLAYQRGGAVSTFTEGHRNEERRLLAYFTDGEQRFRAIMSAEFRRS
ncbi:hypothetical protein J2R76_003842 [Bradyrhizobium sp. USDA 4532]|nr:hypothetical protein [Bradyrhizobium sp. USDA 4545]MCP1920251.1 hypothetical protein [Bradyrhizobium sp. USDA 4532]